MRFVFTGKSGLRHEVRSRDARVARVLRKCQEIPGQRLFQYVGDDGGIEPVYSNDVNDYLREAAGVDVTAKDFRTWVATVSAASALASVDAPTSETEAKTVLNAVVREVASELGNTPAVCRASYIHPQVLSTFEAGELQDRVVRVPTSAGPAHRRRAPHAHGARRPPRPATASTRPDHARLITLG